MIEIYKEIKWYEWLYRVSNLWNVKNNKNKILKNKSYQGYSLIALYKNKIRKDLRVHRLVAQAFLWLLIENKDILVCHKIEKLHNWLLDNSVENLFLWTQKDNILDMFKKWRSWIKWKFWINNHLSKKIKQYDINWVFIKKWNSMVDVKRELNIDYTWISLCCNRKQKTAWGFKWEYNLIKQ